MGDLAPASLFARFRSEALEPDRAWLFWGKSAAATWEALRPSGPVLVISNQPRPGQLARNVSWVRGEHPLPGAGSLAAGRALLEFFNLLRGAHIRELRAFLSGGASSLAWLPPAGMSAIELHSRLSALYARGLPIAELNRARARLCLLKAGGAARALDFLAPRVRARVELISDVLPYGPQVVGSGPFWNGRIPHHVAADGERWVRGFASAFAAQGVPVLERAWGRVDSGARWRSDLAQAARQALRARKSGVFLRGGEPAVALPAATGRGGRMTQLALGLLAELHSELAEGRVAVACLSSDGVDGRSGAAGAIVDRRVARRAEAEARRRALTPASLFAQSLRRFDAAEPLRRWGALFPAFASPTNVQDVVIVHVMASGLLGTE